MLGPIVEGERVRLEPVTRDHLPLLAKWRSDLVATRFLLILQFPPSPTQHDEWLEKSSASDEAIVWSVVDRSDEVAVGLCGFEKVSWRHRHATGWTFIGDRTAGSAALAPKRRVYGPRMAFITWASKR
jgi:RimJ/RimL family protein N-acetyltransferase